MMLATQPETLLNEPTPDSTRDVFHVPLASAVCIAFALPLALFAGDLAWRRIPTFESIFLDFGVQELPAGTELLIRVPWLPFAVSIFAIVLGVVSLVVARRRALVIASCVAIISFYCVYAAQLALHGPLLHLMQALSS